MQSGFPSISQRHRYLVHDIDSLMRSCAKFLTANLTATGLDKGG